MDDRPEAQAKCVVCELIKPFYMEFVPNPSASGATRALCEDCGKFIAAFVNEPQD